jgi:hypothetical protein
MVLLPTAIQIDNLLIAIYSDILKADLYYLWLDNENREDYNLIDLHCIFRRPN